MLNLAGIGAANLLFYSFFFGVAFTAGRLLWFQFATALVGIFPVAIFVLLTERGRRRRFEAGAAQLQENLPAAGSQPAPAGSLRLSGADGKSAPAIDASSLLYAQSTGNYVDIFYASGGLRRYTLRSTLRAVEEQLALHPHFVRCHRRYIVNLLQVSSVSGNAQGYRLHLPGVPDPVPVARQHAALVKARLSRR